MAQKAAKKTAAPKKRTAGSSRKKNRKSSPGSGFSKERFLYVIVLLVLLAFSVGMVGYVVFFRTVVAAELPLGEKTIIFEEPHHPEADSYNQKHTGGHAGMGRAAIIIDDMGYHHSVGRQLLHLPLNLSFSFLPYAPFTPELEEEAYQLGKTILLHLPMEPRSPEWDPGPNALYLSDSREVHEKAVNLGLAVVAHATGVNSHMGSKYSENLEAMEALASMLRERRLFYIDSLTSPHSQGLKAARAKGVPSSKRDVFLDNVQEQEQICSRIEELAAIAGKRGKAIAIGHPFPETLNALKECAPKALEGVELVGVDRLLE